MALTFRNSHGELIDLPIVAATKAKNEFGAVLEQAVASGAVAITRHDTPKAVLMSYVEFSSLVNARTSSLDDLSAEFDGPVGTHADAGSSQGCGGGIRRVARRVGPCRRHCRLASCRCHPAARSAACYRATPSAPPRALARSQRALPPFAHLRPRGRERRRKEQHRRRGDS